MALGSIRGPASVAAALYDETAESLAAARERALETRRLAPEPPSAGARAARPSATAAPSPSGTAGAPARED